MKNIMYTKDELQKWHNSQAHETVREIVCTQFKGWCPNAYGDLALVLGDFIKNLTPPEHNFSRTLHLGEHSADISCDVHALPFKEDSCELCVIPFGFDFASDPYQLMREANRVLSAGGYMVICGFNPLSLISIGALIPPFRNVLPWRGQFVQPSQIKDWLTLLGYQVTENSRMLFNPLLIKGGKPTQFDVYFEKLFPSAGSIYWLVAKKQRAPLTPQNSLETLKNNVWLPLGALNRNGIN